MRQRGPGGGWSGARRSGTASAPRGAAAGATCRGLLGLLRPYRGARGGDAVRAALGTAASLAPPLLAKVAIDQGITQHDTTHARARRGRLPRLGAARVGDDLRCRPTSSAGSASARSRTCASASSPTCSAADRLLREPARGRADLAHDQRRGGARQPRHRLRRHAVPGRPDAARHDRDPAVSSTRSSRC